MLVMRMRVIVSSISLAFAGQSAFLNILLSNHIHPDQVEQPSRHTAVDEALNLVPKRSVCEHHVAQVFKRALHTLLSAHAKEIILVAGHSSGDVRRFEGKEVDVGLLAGEVICEQVDVGLAGGIGVVQRKRSLPQVNRVLPATEPTLMMALLLPVRLKRYQKSGMKRWLSAAKAQQLRYSCSSNAEGARLVKLSSTSTPALLTTIEMSLKADSCGSRSSALSLRPSWPRSATTISTFTAGYNLRISWRTACSLASVRASKITLNPSFANCSANSLPIPSEEPVTSAQLFSPQRCTRLSLR